MEYLVEFDVHVPEGTAELLVAERTTAEAAAAAELADQGYLVRLWKLSDNGSGVRALGLFRAATETELDALLAGLPLYEWMDVTVIRLDAHPNDPHIPEATQTFASPGDQTEP
jgi:muconolactone D-isomerase